METPAESHKTLIAEDAMPPDPVLRHVRAVARHVLMISLGGNRKEVSYALNRMLEECAEHTTVGLYEWCDEAIGTIRHTFPDTADAMRIIESTQHTETHKGRAGDKWAGRMLQARFDGDRQGCLTALSTVNQLSPNLRTEYIAALLRLCTTCCVASTMIDAIFDDE